MGDLRSVFKFTKGLESNTYPIHRAFIFYRSWMLSPLGGMEGSGATSVSIRAHLFGGVGVNWLRYNTVNSEIPQVDCHGKR